MTINDNVSFDKIPSTDINGRCIPPPYSSKTNSITPQFLTFFCFDDHARDNWKVSLKCDEPFSRYEYLYQIRDLVQ